MEEISLYRNGYLIEGLHIVDSAKVGGTREDCGGLPKAFLQISKEPAESLRVGCHFKCSHNESVAWPGLLNWGGKRGARVCIRGASIYARPEERTPYRRGSLETAQGPPKITHFRWP